MSVVEDSYICEKCEGIKIIHFNCNTYEEFETCITCGDFSETTRNEKGEFNSPVHEEGYGVTCIKTSSINYLSFKHEPSDKEIKKSVNLIKSGQYKGESINQEESYVTFMRNGKLKVAFGKPFMWEDILVKA